MPYFDRFDIAEAHFIAACDWGLWGDISQLDRMRFKARPSLQTRDNLTDNGRQIYDLLDAKYRRQHDMLGLVGSKTGY